MPDSLERRLEKGKFIRLLEASLPPKTHPIYGHWREYGLSSIERGREIVRFLFPLLKINGARVLDLGCGSGGHAVALAEAGAKVTGIDSKEMPLNLARALAEDFDVAVDFHVDSEYGNFLPDGEFDLIICNDVIEHVDSFERLAASQRRLLRDGGLLYMTVPNRFNIKHFLKDPHYQLVGVSILGPRLGAFYVTKIRRKGQHYNVNRLLGWDEARRIYRNAGIELTYYPVRDLLERLRTETTSTPFKRVMTAIVRTRLVMRIHIFFLQENWQFVGRR